MPIIESSEEYAASFYKSLESIERVQSVDKINKYSERQLQQLDELVQIISRENFWQVLPKILGIDAKLSLVIELTRFDDFSEDDIVRIVENDYATYFKELCGYNLNMETNHSMVFNAS